MGLTLPDGYELPEGTKSLSTVLPGGLGPLKGRSRPPKPLPATLPAATSHGAARFVVDVQGWRPVLLNEFVYGHWSVMSRRKHADACTLALECARAGVTRAIGKRRVRLEVTLGPRRKRFDADAPWKGLLDALRRIGAIRDDNAEFCEHDSDIPFTRGPQTATRVILEDV